MNHPKKVALSVAILGLVAVVATASVCYVAPALRGVRPQVATDKADAPSAEAVQASRAASLTAPAAHRGAVATERLPGDVESPAADPAITSRTSGAAATSGSRAGSVAHRSLADPSAGVSDDSTPTAAARRPVHIVRIDPASGSQILSGGDTGAAPAPAEASALEPTAGAATTGNPYPSVIMAIDPNVAPVADAGADLSVKDYDQTGDELVTLDGSASLDPDGSIVSWVWSEGGSVIATGETADVLLAVGEHTITLEVTDNIGATSTDEVLVTVEHVVPVILRFAQSGTNLDITAARQDNSEVYWKLRLDQTRGVITQFYDMKSDAGATYNYASPYALGPGLFAPYSIDIRSTTGTTYSQGPRVDGQKTFTYTIRRNNGTLGWYESAVTIKVPTPDGTTFAAATTVHYDVSASVGQTASPHLELHAPSQAMMPLIYEGSVQDSVAVDGTLWSQVRVLNSTESQTLGLTPGRTFRLTALNLNDGQLGWDGAAALSWLSPYEVRNWVTGGIYDNYASKPPAGTTLTIYSQLAIDITGDGYIPNIPPVAEAGNDQTVVDMDADNQEAITLDGALSSDADGAVVAWAWSEGETPLGAGDRLTVSLPVGTHLITLTVTDDQGAQATDTVTITVEPRIPGTYYVDRDNPASSDSNPGTIDLPWKTLGKAASTAFAGDTVIIREGVYRSQVSLQHSGNVDAPITFRAKPGERVVVAGSDELSGWHPLPESSARGNPNYPNIYYVDLNWQPVRLDEDEKQMEMARSPNNGWWLVGEGSFGASPDSTIVDTVNLTQPGADYWVGATMRYRDMQPIITGDHLVTGYDPVAHSVTIAGNVTWTDSGGTPWPPVPGMDRYYMFNKLELLDRPGEWAVENVSGATYRVYIWPAQSGAPDGHMYEATRVTGSLFSTGGRSNIVIDGLEFRHTGGYGSGLNIPGGTDVTVQNCVVHDNDYMGIRVGNASRVIIRHNVSTANGYGISVGTCTDVLIHGNDVSWNTVDGIVASYTAANIYVEQNYIHHHMLWGHPDNMQTHHGVTNMWVEDNVILASGQSFMIEQTDGLHFRNNIITGCGGYMLHGGADNQTLIGNTLAFSGYGLLSLGGTGYTLYDNILYHGHANIAYGVSSTDAYVADNNVFYQGPGIGDKILSWNGTYMTVATFASTTGQETHSIYADPQFINAPVCMAQLASSQIPYFEVNRIAVDSYADTFSVGDHIEFNYDGVVRTITAKSGNWLTYTPAHDEPLWMGGIVTNWKARTNFDLDMRPAAGSPALTASRSGGQSGSTLDMANYRAGDFDGDGIRDIPVWPLGAPVDAGLASWEIGPPAGMPGAMMPANEGDVDSRSAGVGTLRLSFTYPLDPATVASGAVTIVGQSGGDVSGMITSLALESDDTVLAVTLSGRLPDADRYTVTLADTVRASGGGAVVGSRSRQFAALAGDVDASGAVTQADVTVLRNHLGDDATGAAARYDINGDGQISAGDLREVRSAIGHALP